MKYFISFILGAVFAVILCASQGLVTEVVVEKEIIKEVPVEIIVEKETSDTAEVKNKYQEGTYKVGRDIPAGEYRAEVNNKSLTTDSIYIYIGENPNFNNYNDYTISSYNNVGLFIAEDGDYIQVSNADFYYLG